MLLDSFLKGYMACALWASTDEHGEPLDTLASLDDFDTTALATMRDDCADFLASNAADLRAYEQAGRNATDAGHDFWLTRNGHGAGFWDRGLGELGQRLTDAAKVYGSCDLYAGDDGWLYVA